MKFTKSTVLKPGAAISLVACSVAASAQSANDPILTITEDTFLDAISLIQPTLAVEKKNVGYKVTLPNGVQADARLQNCENREKLNGCRTVSLIANLLAPEGKSREELLEMVNTLNKRDIHSRAFLNNNDKVIVRWTFFGTGHDTSRGLVAKLAQWDAHVRWSANYLYSKDE